MKTFKDLEFTDKDHIDGQRAVLEFDNGYGVSVITGYGAYGNAESPYEIAILKEGSLCYDTPITNNVIGYNTAEEVTEYMKKIQKL